MGLKDSQSLWSAKLTKTIKKKRGRLEFVRAVVSNQEGQAIVEPTSRQDSHMLTGSATANALIVFPLEAERLEAGEMVTVQTLCWNLA